MKTDTGGPERALLSGRGEELLILVVARSTTAQLNDWLKLPLELSPTEAVFLLEPNQCCQLRRKGEELLQFVMARASDEQWCKWLQIPLEHALITGKALLVEPLLAAGAGIAKAVGGGGGGGGRGGGRENNAREGTDDAAAPSPSSSSCSSGAATTRSTVDQAAAAAAAAISSTPSCCPGPPPPQPGRKSSTFGCSSSKRVPSAAALAAASSCCPSPVAVTVSRFSSNNSGGAPASSCSSSSGKSGKRCGGGGGGGRGGAAIDLAAAAAAAAASPEAAARVYAGDKLCLHRATKARDSVLMRELLAAGVDRNATDLWGCTALHRAAEMKLKVSVEHSQEPVRLLLAAGLDVGARDMEGYSPLHFAAARTSPFLLDFLAAGSCVADRGNNGDTPLHSAVRFLSLSTARILLEADADETAENDDGDTPRDVTGVRPDGRDIEDQDDPLVAQEIIALLDAAPRQRRWKRRGWFVMLQARAQAEAARELAEAASTGCLVMVGKEEGDTNAEKGCGSDDPGKGCEGGDDGDGDGASSGGGGGSDVLAGVCGAGAAVVKSGGFSELVEKTTLLAEAGLFQKVVRFL